MAFRVNTFIRLIRFSWEERKALFSVYFDSKAAYFEDKFESNTNILNYMKPSSTHMYVLYNMYIVYTTGTESKTKPNQTEVGVSYKRTFLRLIESLISNFA